MQRVIETEHAALLSGAAAFLDAEHDRGRARRAASLPGGFDRPFWRRMAEMGLIGTRLPEPLGGRGLPLPETLLLAEQLGRRLVPEPFVGAAVMAGTILGRGADGAAAGDLVAGRRLVVPAWPAGDDPVASAWDDGASAPGPESLRGARVAGPHAAAADVFLLRCDVAGEPAVVALDRDAGGSNGGEAAAARLPDAPIGTDAPLLRGAPAVEAWREMMAAGVLGVAAELAGIASGALSLTLEQLGHRVQFGRPIGSFQALQHRAVDLLATVELAEASWRHAARRLDAEGATPAALAAVSAAKARCSDAAMDAARAGVQLHGAMGYTEEAEIGLYLGAALRLSGWLGTAATHRRRFLAARRGEGA